MRGGLAAVCCAAAVFVTSGCTTWRESHTERTAVELMLLSTAARNASAILRLGALEGRKVSVDAANFDTSDQEYALSCIRERLLKHGALLTSFDDAEIIVEARSGVLNTDHAYSMVGIPSIPIGIPGMGNTEIPEFTLWGMMSQTGWATIALAAYEKESGRRIAEASSYGTAYYNRYTLLFLITWSTSDIPERRRGALWGLFPSLAR